MSYKAGESHLTIPYGLKFKFKYSEHNSSIKQLEYNRMTGSFASLDDRCLRLWSEYGPIKRIAFPPTQRHFIQAFIWVPSLEVFIAAALDMSLKVYDESFDLLHSCVTRARAILSLAFDERKGSLLTGGVDGTIIWRFVPQTERVFKSKWVNQRRFELTRERMLSDGAKWVKHVKIEGDFIFELWEASISIYDYHSLELLSSLSDIHGSCITSFLIFRQLRYLLTAGSDATVKVWNMSRNNAAVKVFDMNSKAVTAMALHGSNLVLVASLDKTLRAINVETLTEVYRVDVGLPIYSMMLACRTGTEQVAQVVLLCDRRVSVWEFNEVTSVWNICRSTVTGLRRAWIPAVHLEDDGVSPIKRVEATDPPDLNPVSLLSEGSGMAGLPASPHKTIKKSPGHAGNSVAEHKDISLAVATGAKADFLTGTSLDPTGSRASQTVSEVPLEVVMAHAEDGSARLFDANTARLLSTLLPDSILSSMVMFEYSASQELLFVLLSNGDILVYSARGVTCKRLAHWTGIGVDLLGEDDITTICLMDIMPKVTDSLTTNHAASKLRKQSSLMLGGGLRGQGMTSAGQAGAISSGRRVANVRGHVDYGPPEILACGTVKGRLLFLDTRQNGELIASKNAHRARVTHLIFDCRAETLVSCSEKGEAKVWAAASMREVSYLRDMTAAAPTRSNPIQCQVVSVVHSLVYFGYADGSGAMLQTVTGERLPWGRRDFDHAGSVLSASFSNSMGIIATSGADKSIKLWTLQRVLLAQVLLPSISRGICFLNNDGDLLVSEHDNVSVVKAETYMKGTGDMFHMLRGCTLRVKRQRREPRKVKSTEPARIVSEEVDLATAPGADLVSQAAEDPPMHPVAGLVTTEQAVSAEPAKGVVIPRESQYLLDMARITDHPIEAVVEVARPPAVLEEMIPESVSCEIVSMPAIHHLATIEPPPPGDSASSNSREPAMPLPTKPTKRRYKRPARPVSRPMKRKIVPLVPLREEMTSERLVRRSVPSTSLEKYRKDPLVGPDFFSVQSCAWGTASPTRPDGGTEKTLSVVNVSLSAVSPRLARVPLANRKKHGEYILESPGQAPHSNYGEFLPAMSPARPERSRHHEDSWDLHGNAEKGVGSLDRLDSGAPNLFTRKPAPSEPVFLYQQRVKFSSS